MTARCTVCGRCWIVAAEQAKPGYICPDCAARARMEESGIIKKERRNQNEIT
jgi:DNA-directed RNA polymerase subunit RPC12/RpoP